MGNIYLLQKESSMRKMLKRTLGKTNLPVTALGLGCMRLPTIEEGKPEINHEKAIELIRKAVDSGINYLDTAYSYHNKESELVLGKALKDGYREKVYLATKLPIWHEEFKEQKDFDRYLDEALEKLDVEYIDFYLLHALNEKTYREKVVGLNVLERAKKAKEEGKIKYIGFSFHDKVELLKEILDDNEFDLVLLQYNILDKVNEEMIQYANEKGLAVAIMGPVGGGRLAGDLPDDMKHLLTEGRNDLVDHALRFVLSNPNVSVALSGLGSLEMLEDSLKILSNEKIGAPLTKEEKETIDTIEKTFKEKTDLICTACGYCMPCPNEVNIKEIFRFLIAHDVYGQITHSKHLYSLIGKEKSPFKGKNAEACIECGECEPKCPQKIPIIEQLKKAHKTLA